MFECALLGVAAFLAGDWAVHGGADKAGLSIARPAAGGMDFRGYGVALGVGLAAAALGLIKVKGE